MPYFQKYDVFVITEFRNGCIVNVSKKPIRSEWREIPKEEPIPNEVGVGSLIYAPCGGVNDAHFGPTKPVV